MYIDPGLRPGQLPELHRLGEYLFQELCRDVLDTEPETAYCEVYGVRGQAQRGVDLLGARRGNDGYDVGQCKAYENFPPAQIRKASDEFLDHEDHWLSQGVRRFHLFVACDLSTTQQLDEIARQRRRFAEIGIEYQAWSAVQIRNRLRSYPQIVRTYLSPPDTWVNIICGTGIASSTPLAGPPDRMQVFVDASTAGLLERLAEAQSTETRQRVEQLREAWRAGRKSEAIAGVRAIRSDVEIWRVLSPAVQSHVLRFESSLALDESSGVQRARELVAEARRAAPEEDYSRIEALIELKSGNAEAALSRLTPFQSRDHRNLAAAILLEGGRISEALDVLDVSGHALEPNAETFRLLALARVLQKELDQARLAAQRAVELAPAWTTTRYTLALINYLSSLSLAAVPDDLRGWPSPIPPTLVRRDDQSIARLRAAAEEFADLARAPEVGAPERITYETYRLACLANDPERQDEALGYCSELLGSDATHPGAIAWSVGREYAVNREAIEAALRERIARDEDVQPALSLIMALLAWDRPSEAHEIVESTHNRFVRANAVDAWEFWQTQIQLALAAAEGNATTIRIPADRPDLRLVQCRLEAERTGNWKPFAEAVEEEYGRTQDPVLLFDLCRAYARTGDWTAAAKQADDLVARIGTPDALHFAVSAAVNAQEFELALRLLDENRALFPKGGLPHDLRSARVRVLQALGELSGAAVEAETLARENPDLQHVFPWAQILYQKGDFAGFRRVARRIASRTDLDSATSLRFARALVNEEPGLAAGFWRAATQGNLPDDAVAAAVEVGLRLGFGAEMRPLMARFYEIANRGGPNARMIAPAEIETMYRAWNENSANVEQRFRRGEVPVHFVAEHLGVPLSDLYHGRLEANERSPNPARQYALPVRHGIRGLPITLPQPADERRLNADVTALLLAEHLGVLDEVERWYAPIRIPAETIPELIEMREALAPVQPTRLQALKEIADLREAGALKPVSSATSQDSPWAEEVGADRSALVSVARADGGCVVDYLPIQTSLSAAPRDPPEEIQPFFANSRAVVEGLWRDGPLSETAYRNVLSRLGSEGQAEARYRVPAAGSLLLLTGNVPELLASAGVLALVCRHFRVMVEEKELEYARRTLAEAEERWHQREWVNQLIERLRSGLDENRYRAIPTARGDRSLDDDDEDDRVRTWSGLRTLLTFPAEPGDVLWTDDRWLTGYWSREGVPVFGTPEILQDLRQRGKIDENRRLELLLRLRAANARFMPLSGAETAHHLHSAQVKDGAVRETEAVSILRRYTAAMLLDVADWMQPPVHADGSENPRSEVPVLISLERAASDALVLVWTREDGAEPDRVARADWIASNLLLDIAMTRRLAGLRRSTDNDSALVAATLGSLIAWGARIGWEGGPDKAKRRKEYYRWLTLRLLQPRFEADSAMLPLVAEYVKKMLFSAEDSGDDAEIRRVGRVIALRDVFDDLPEPIRDQLASDPELMSSLAMKTTLTVEIASLPFDRAEFVQAAAAAVNGESAVITPVEATEGVRFEPLEDRGHGGFRLVRPSGGVSAVKIHNPILALLSESPALREAVLRDHPEWFDGPESEFENWVGEIASMENPCERLSAAEERLRESATLYYRGLADRIRANKRLKYDDLLPPTGDCLLRHFRLKTDIPGGGGASRFLDPIAEGLVRQHGLAGAMERWWGLPVPLPDRLLAHVAELAPTARRELFRCLLRMAGSPTSEMHLLRLLWSYPGEDPAYQRLVKRRATRILSDRGQEGVAAYLKLLRWLQGQFDLRPDFCELPAHVRLAALWLHAHRVYSAFAAAGAEQSGLAAAFDAGPQRLAMRFLHEDKEYANDVTNPTRLSYQFLILAGLTYVFSGTRRKQVPQEVSRGLAALCFVEDENVRLPRPAVLRDPTLFGNLLDSYLANRRQRPLTALLGRADAQRLSREQLAELGRTALEAARNRPDQVDAWGVLWSLIGDLPPTAALHEPLAEAVLQTDFEAVVRNQPAIGGVALQVAASIAANLPDRQPREHVRRHLLSIAREVASKRPIPSGRLLADDSPVPAARYLIQSAVELSKSETQPDGSVGTFVKLLEELVSAWPALGRALASFVQQAVEELPVRDGQQFARLLLLCRAA